MKKKKVQPICITKPRPQQNNETFCFLAFLPFFRFTQSDFGPNRRAGAALEAPLPETYSGCTNKFVMSLVGRRREEGRLVEAPPNQEANIIIQQANKQSFVR